MLVLSSVAEPYHHNEIDPKVGKNLYTVDPIIVAKPYHLSRACAVTRLKLARCDVGVLLLYSCMSIDDCQITLTFP
jgi:hypothetical protein